MLNGKVSHLGWEGNLCPLLGPGVQRGCMQVTQGRSNMGGSQAGETGLPLILPRGGRNWELFELGTTKIAVPQSSP